MSTRPTQDAPGMRAADRELRPRVAGEVADALDLRAELVTVRLAVQQGEDLAERGHRRLPGFVRRELYGYLDCGFLANGFARVHCASCGRDELVAFACKGRGVADGRCR